MKRIALILVVLITQAVWAQDWARTQLAKSPRHQEWVTVKHDGRSVETFVVYPESKDKRPVVVLIHEIFGMSDWVQDLADQVAAAGYIAVAPDLLSGMGPNGGRTSDVAPGQSDGSGEPSQSRPGHCRSQRGLRLRQETSRVQWQVVCGRLLLGRWTNFSLCHQSSRSGGGFCFLRSASR